MRMSQGMVVAMLSNTPSGFCIRLQHSCLLLQETQHNMQGRVQLQTSTPNKHTHFREGLVQGQQLALQDSARMHFGEVGQVRGVHQHVLCSVPYKQALQSLLSGRPLLCQPTHDLQLTLLAKACHMLYAMCKELARTQSCNRSAPQ